MASARRGEVVCECEVPECSPCPIGFSGQGKRHWHASDRIARKPIVEVSTWSQKEAEMIAATMELSAKITSSPANGKGMATGTSKRKAPRTISEDTRGNAKTKGKGNGKRKMPRAAAEEGSQFPKKSPRIGPDYQVVLPPLPPLRPRPGSRENTCRKAWGAPADTMSEEAKSMDLFTVQLSTEFRTDISEDEILETLRATEGMGIGHRRFTHARPTLAQKVAAKAEAAAAAASAVNVLSLWAKEAIAVATAASAEAFTALSGGAPSAAVPSAEASAIASSGTFFSSEAANSPSA